MSSLLWKIFASTLSYHVPEELLAVQSPPVPKVTPMPRWKPDPKVELLNPWRYWVLIRRSDRKSFFGLQSERFVAA